MLFEPESSRLLVEILFGAASVFFYTLLFSFACGCLHGCFQTFRGRPEPESQLSILPSESFFGSARRSALAEVKARVDMEAQCARLMRSETRPMGEDKDAERKEAIAWMEGWSSCCICMEDKPTSSFTTLHPCKHSFCNYCLFKQRWHAPLDQAPCCALCRTPPEREQCHAVDFAVRFRWHYRLSWAV